MPVFSSKNVLKIPQRADTAEVQREEKNSSREVRNLLETTESKKVIGGRQLKGRFKNK